MVGNYLLRWQCTGCSEVGQVLLIIVVIVRVPLGPFLGGGCQVLSFSGCGLFSLSLLMLMLLLMVLLFPVSVSVMLLLLLLGTRDWPGGMLLLGLG